MRWLTLMIVTLLSFAAVSYAATETRGLRVVAKDTLTNQTGEVALYNKSFAVIIGIDQYQNLPRDRQLKNAVTDAKGVEAVLTKNFRFDKIIHLYNSEATKDRILEVLTEELPAQMGDQDSLFLFWAGHSDQEQGAQGKEIGYLIPYDGEVGKIRKNLTMTELRDTISVKLPAKHVFYVMDACYGGLLASTRGVDKKSRRDLSYLKEITKENVRQVLTAGGKGEEVLDGGPKGHSVFTGRLIEALEAAGDFITANEIQAILKEKVFGDSKGQGKTQTPAFGTLSGNGDYVFVPNPGQKARDNSAELTRIEAELKSLEVQEANARKSQTEQQQREVEQKRKAVEAKLKAEQFRQQQLAEEGKRQNEMADERLRFDAEQKRREQELTTSQKAEEERLTALKTELARKKQSAISVTSTGSLQSTVAELKRLNAEIEGIEATFDRELVSGKNRIATRYDKEIATVSLASKQKQKPLVRDEFETDADYRARSAKQQSLFSDRIAELVQKKQDEINGLAQRLASEQQTQTADLRQSMKQLGDKEFSIGSESLSLELGQYNPDKQNFPVNIRNRTNDINVAMNGTIPLPRESARKFKQEYSSGLVRPEVTLKAGNGDLLRVALANDSDSNVYQYVAGEFIAVTELRRREAAAVAVAAVAAERERIIYTDKETGLMWVRNGNIAGKIMNWNDAMTWAKNLNYGGYSDWRLPTKEELEAFSKRGGSRSAEWLNANGFTAVQSAYYWSSSSYSGSTSYAWSVYMLDGYVVSYDKSGFNYFVWPVRAGQ